MRRIQVVSGNAPFGRAEVLVVEPEKIDVVCVLPGIPFHGALHTLNPFPSCVRHAVPAAPGLRKGKKTQ